MIVVSYVLSSDPVVLREQQSVNLAKADLVDLCYSCFGGDLTLKVNDADFSIVTGGGVQILDFALEFFTAGSSLKSGDSAQVTFAGMSDEIYLVPSGESVRVSSSYTEDGVEVLKSEITSASREFLAKLLVDLGNRYPDLRKNRNVKKVASSAGLRW
ncbi:hypothetical protein [Streptomyces sp. NPDC000229]|uniref:hypothetical protein n=1 Tax=Streptomyces sp. NPDC000229 TaxID=3154247 RepID=UPI003330539F